MNELNLDSKVKVNPDVLSKWSDGKYVVMLVNEDGHFFEIDGLAANIWQLISLEEENYTSLRAIYEKILSEYSPPAEEFKADFTHFLQNLYDHKILLSAT